MNLFQNLALLAALSIHPVLFIYLYETFETLTNNRRLSSVVAVWYFCFSFVNVARVACNAPTLSSDVAFDDADVVC
jgi:hypothetical protein